MRRTLLLLAALSMLLTAFAPAPSSPGLAPTCRIDGAVAHSGAVGVVTCTDIGGDKFAVDVVVTLQSKGSGAWEDVASERCTGTSTNGVASLTCEVVEASTGTPPRRAVVDLASPRDLEPVELRPTPQGALIPNALADDECGVNEVIDDRDLTTPPAPWADVCAITVAHELDTTDDKVTLSSFTVIVHVAGMLDSRPGTTAWRADLDTENCSHVVQASDAGLIGEAGVQVRSQCNWLGWGPCDVVYDLIYGDSCRSGLGYADEEVVTLPANTVSFTDTEVAITVNTDDLGPLAGSDLVAGATVLQVDGGSSSGIGSSTDGSRATLSTEFAWSNGRTHTFD